jgi:hypothetical protein
MSRGNQGHKTGAAALTHAQFQRAVAGFLNSRLIPPDFFSAFPAGGGGKMRGWLLKVMGLKPGMPDFFPVVINGIEYGIELKVGRDVLSDAQIRTHADLLAAGVTKEIAVCRPSPENTLNQIREVLERWGAKLRAVPPTLERLQMAIESWNLSKKNSLVEPVDNFPSSDQIGSRRSLSKSVSLKF